MGFSKLFIDRPILAGVISVLIMLVGAVAYLALPISQYPEVAPPSITVTVSYPGANAETAAATVAAPLEQEINGVENMLYLSSQSTADGRTTITVTFALGTDLDTAQVLVQNRVKSASSSSGGSPTRRSSGTCSSRARMNVWDACVTSGASS
jgi:multidrug efflux pump subunit AcrB